VTIDYAAKLWDLYPYANDVSRAAGVGYPASNTSPGAKWLMRIRDAFAEDAERIMTSAEPSDEIEYDGMECYTAEQWRIFTDLALWQYDADIAYSDQAEFRTAYFTTESALAVRVSDIPNLAGKLLDEIAGNLGHLFMNDLQQWAEEGDADA
jgi:hypothetical protein